MQYGNAGAQQNQIMSNRRSFLAALASLVVVPFAPKPKYFGADWSWGPDTLAILHGRYRPRLGKEILITINGRQMAESMAKVSHAASTSY